MVHCHIFPVSKKMRKIRHVFFKNLLNQGNKKAVTKRGRNVPISRGTMDFIIKLQIDDTQLHQLGCSTGKHIEFIFNS